MTDIGLWNIAATDPERTAVIDPSGTAVSYAELAAQADRYGRGLQALGLRPGDCVAGMLPNSTEALALFFAAIQTGLYVVPVNWHLTAAEVAYILADSGARAFVAHERFGEVAAEAAGRAGNRSRRPGSPWGRYPASPRWPRSARTATGAPARAPRAPRWSTRPARRAGPRACAAR